MVGAHVDSAIDEKYSFLSDEFFQLAVAVNASAAESPASIKKHLKDIKPNIPYASIRQIAFEVMCTVDDYLNTGYVARTKRATNRPSYTIIPTAQSMIVIPESPSAKN